MGFRLQVLSGCDEGCFIGHLHACNKGFKRVIVGVWGVQQNVYKVAFV